MDSDSNRNRIGLRFSIRENLLLSVAGIFCKWEELMNGMPHITATELKQRLDNGDDIQIVDVREQNEVDIAKMPGTIHIPLGQILNRMSEIDPKRETVVHCKMGGRSARAITLLKQAGFSGELANLTGGIIAWSNDVDPSVPKY
jgi:sulfur-carrier protein adenylyltransferase/sulfurtransferase